MTIPPRFLQDLRDRLSLSDIIGRRVKLSRAGREFKGCCPFHHEKTPSFYVNDDKQFYHCFGCGAHGDAIEFVMQHDNLSFVEAVETLAAQAGMSVPKPSPEEAARARQEKDLHSLMDDAARFFESRLRDGANADALQYLHDRGMDDGMLSAFRIGYAPADGQAVRKYLKEKGYTDQQMIETGMVRASSRGGEPYGFFRDRIMFPVADRRGRIVAFGGRVLPEHIRPLTPGADKPPKYINSSDTTLFHKGRMLYGESQARQAAADGQPVIVVEGYVDVMACYQAGFRGAVAPLGTALTEEQIMVLWKMIPAAQKTPVLCFDGDEAGRRAAARACERLLPLLQPDQSASFVFLPEGQDPDSMIRSQGRKAFEAVLETSMPLVDFLWRHYTDGRRFETPESRAGLSKTLEDEAGRIADRSVQQYYRQAFRDRLFSAFGRNWQPGKAKAGGKTAGAIKIPRPATDNTELFRMVLLAAALNHPFLLGHFEEELGRLALAEERLDRLRQEIVLYAARGDGLDRAALQHYLIQQGFDREIKILLSERIAAAARFIRPGTDEDEVLSKWSEFWQEIQRVAEAQFLKQQQAAGQTDSDAA